MSYRFTLTFCTTLSFWIKLVRFNSENACINPSDKGEGLVRAGIILCRKSTSCQDSSNVPYNIVVQQDVGEAKG